MSKQNKDSANQTNQEAVGQENLEPSATCGPYTYVDNTLESDAIYNRYNTVAMNTPGTSPRDTEKNSSNQKSSGVGRR